MTPVHNPSICTVLRERAGLQPNDTAFTFIDYEQDGAGIAASLTWLQLYRRTLGVAAELRLHASTGDRAVISAPQGLDYIVAFLGALQAGLIAVPLSVPLGGATDERVSSVLRDASPSVILTTSSVVDAVLEAATPRSTHLLYQSSRLICSTPTPRWDPESEARITAAQRICNTRPARLVSPLVSW